MVHIDDNFSFDFGKIKQTVNIFPNNVRQQAGARGKHSQLNVESNSFNSCLHK